MVALGHWDASLAQALAAEVAERHLAHDQDAEHHRQHASGQPQQHLCSIARAARSNIITIEKEALTELLLQSGGAETLGNYLVEPRLCGACLNLWDSLVPCRHNCGRQLCHSCRSEDNTCSNVSLCNQPHPSPSRAAIKLLPENSQIVSRWQIAVERASMCAQQVGQGSRRADQNHRAIEASQQQEATNSKY